MTPKGQQGIIAVDLFEYVTDYVSELEAQKVIVYATVDGDHSLVLFSENFLEQFSRGYLSLPISGFNERSRRQLRQRRRDLEKGRFRSGEKTAAAQELIFELEPLCDKVPEISYGNSEIDAEDFHHVVFVDLLSKIVAWLDETSNVEQELKDAARASFEAYVRAIE